MSEPITRANAVRDFMLRLAEVIENQNIPEDDWRATLSAMIVQVCDESVAYGHAESASPPRVPVSSVCRHDDGSDRDPLVPGQPTEYERDYLTGIEAAAREVDRLADEEGLLPHHFSAAIRALADKPAPTEFRVEPKDGLTWLNFYRAGEFVAGIELRQWLRPQVVDQMVPYFDEIAAREGG